MPGLLVSRATKLNVPPVGTAQATAVITVRIGQVQLVVFACGCGASIDRCSRIVLERGCWARDAWLECLFGNKNISLEARVVVGASNIIAFVL